MSKVIIIGSGIIGSNIAYELSNYSHLEITLIDGKNPGTGSTGSALGLLMGVISRKTKGRGWKLRETSLQRYQTLLPELEALTGLSIPYNKYGIVKLLFTPKQVAKYQKLAQVRQEQGYDLYVWDTDTLKDYCPEVNTEKISKEPIVGGVYSPVDKQINPTNLTKALVKGACLQGVECLFGEKVVDIVADKDSGICLGVNLENRSLSADWIILATGLGTSPLIKPLGGELDIKPVYGQALLIKNDRWCHHDDFNPVITGNDVHIVPLQNQEFWLGATVEFPENATGDITPEELLDNLHHQAISFCPSLIDAPVMFSWTGKRPRPDGKPAPVIEKLAGYHNLILAAGHYRNGVLLAPATAKSVANMISE